jgi:hypothetical protein
MVVQVVILSANGESRQSRLTGDEVTGAAIAKLCRKTKAAEEVGAYDAGEMVLTVWGWTTGKAGTENKHELPPPMDEQLLFGDAVVTASAVEDDATMGFTVAQWESFYKAAFKGFHDTGSGSDSDSDTDSEEDEDEDEDEGEEDAAEEEVDEAAEEAGSADEGDSESEGSDSGSEGAASEEDEADEENEDCYEDGDEGGGGGGKRRAPRRRTTAAPEYRRLEMGLRSRVKVPMPVGRRAPRWQTAAELVEEAYE